MNSALFLALAPMEGVLDPILRGILTEIGGIDRAVSEFIRVTDRPLPAHVLLRDCPELAPEIGLSGRTRSGTPVFVQLLGGQPGPMAESAALAAGLGSPGIDLNFGCPAKTVNRHDGGAALLKNPERIEQVVHAVRVAVPKTIPVTAKVRLGFEDKSRWREIALAAESGGASLLTVHARTKLEMYQPPAHWEYIAWIRESLKIPVVANGEIWSVEDFRRCRAVTGCTGFALGRGLVARPDLALQIRHELAPWSFSSVAPWLHRFWHENEKISEALALGRTKQWCKFLSRSYPEAARLFDRIKTARSRADALAALTHELETERLNPWLPKLSSTPGPFAPTVTAPKLSCVVKA